MTTSESLSCYQKHSGKASDLVRQLAFAGLALVWLFKTDKSGGVKLPANLLWPAGLIILALVLDLVQYTYASAAWGTFNRMVEKHYRDDQEFGAPTWINWPTLICFWAKIAAVIAAYCLLLSYTSGQIFG